jgi:hypothetical protein
MHMDVKSEEFLNLLEGMECDSEWDESDPCQAALKKAKEKRYVIGRKATYESHRTTEKKTESLEKSLRTFDTKTTGAASSASTSAKEDSHALLTAAVKALRKGEDAANKVLVVLKRHSATCGHMKSEMGASLSFLNACPGFLGACGLLSETFIPRV